MPLVGSTAFPFASDCFELVRSILNDADIPSVNIVGSGGIVRLSNGVTVTTQQAHGLQINNIVNVANVLDSSFNGTFQIDSVPSPTTFTYPQFSANATSGTGTVSLIIQGDVYTDTVLLPLINSAYRKVQARLGQSGSKTTTTDVELTIPAGTTEISDTTSPQLPVDFLAPRIMQERISGQPFYGPPMAQVDAIPSYPQQALNCMFSWKDEALFLPGALNDLDVKLRYFKAVLNAITDGTSQILIRGSADAISFYAAYLAARSRGSSASQAIKLDFEEAMHELQNMQAHARQYRPARRRSYGRTGYQGNWRGNYGSF